MKASKTANLMRHMSRYHKLVAADLERQWDQIKGAKMRCRVRDEVTMASPSFTSEVPPASPIIEFPDNGENSTFSVAGRLWDVTHPEQIAA